MQLADVLIAIRMRVADTLFRSRRGKAGSARSYLMDAEGFVCFCFFSKRTVLRADLARIRKRAGGT